MADKSQVLALLGRYTEKIAGLFHLRQVILFGSYAVSRMLIGVCRCLDMAESQTSTTPRT